MTLLGGMSSARPFAGGRPRAFSSSRYTHTDPPRREFGLRLLSELLPEPLRSTLIRIWRHPVHYDGSQAIQSLHRQLPEASSLYGLPPSLLSLLALTEMAAARRVVETPRTEISRDLRNKLLRVHGAYLHNLYGALAAQLGEADAQAEFERLLPQVG